MALPDIAGYLASTRQPLDLVGPAIQAFQAVSSEMRATRAQNLAEEESARDLGKGIKEGMQQDRMFEEDIIDRRQMRGIREQDQMMQMLRLGMDMEEHQFQMQNLMPLEIQSRQLGIARQQQIFDATAQEMQTEQYLRSVGVENLSRIGGLMSGQLPVPEEAIDAAAGETADSSSARVRAAAKQLTMLEPLLKSINDPGLNVQYHNQRRVLEADPEYNALKTRGGLLLPAERGERSGRRLSSLMARLPFDDEGNSNFFSRHRERIYSSLDMPDEEWDAVSKRMIQIADMEYREASGRATGWRGDYVGERNRYDDIVSAQAKLAEAQAALEAAQKTGLSMSIRNAETEVSQAKARLDTLTNAYQGMVPGIPSAPSSPAASGGTTWESFYR